MNLKNLLLGICLGFIAFVAVSIAQEHIISQGGYLVFNFFPHLIKGLVFIVFLTLFLIFWLKRKAKK